MRTVTWSHPFREAQSLAEPNVATSLFHVALAGRGYMIDTANGEFRWQSMDYMRQQQDSQAQAGAQSLATLDLWRRDAQSWHLGAGQSRGDDETSSPFRFATSKGVNPWDKWRLSLLPATALGSAGASTPAALAVAAGRLVYQSGQSFSVTDDGDEWVEFTTLAQTPTTQAVSDGSNLYAGCGNSKIVRLDPSGVATEPWDVGAVPQVVAVSKGRVWAGVGTALKWMVPGSGTVTDAVTVPFAEWRWTALCEGPRATYAAGFSGDRSAIYRIPLKADGSGLDAGTVAATLPDGEVVHALASYLGYFLIGTSQGLRFAVADDAGDLTYGSFIPTPEPVRCFEPQDRFVWFGWSNFDAVATGLGRVDLTNFTATLTPAYASDLMHVGQGSVSSVATFGDRRFFTVDGVGVVCQTQTPVAQGTVQQSEVTYGLQDPKIATLVGLTHESLDGSVSVTLTVDGAGSGIVAESAVQGSTGPASPFALNPVSGRRFSLGMILTRGVADGPVVTGLVLMAHPVPPRGEQFILPLMIAEQVDLDGFYAPFDPPEEVQFLRGLVRRGQAVQLQIGAEAFTVFPANYRWTPYKQTQTKDGWTGTCIMELREVTR